MIRLTTRMPKWTKVVRQSAKITLKNLAKASKAEAKAAAAAKKLAPKTVRGATLHEQQQMDQQAAQARRLAQPSEVGANLTEREKSIFSAALPKQLPGPSEGPVRDSPAPLAAVLGTALAGVGVASGVSARKLTRGSDRAGTSSSSVAVPSSPVKGGGTDSPYRKPRPNVGTAAGPSRPGGSMTSPAGAGGRRLTGAAAALAEMKRIDKEEKKRLKAITQAASSSSQSSSIAAPVAIGSVQAARSPKFYTPALGRGTSRLHVGVKHREFVMDINSQNGGSGFNVLATITVNPSIGDFAPWLAQIAKCFQQYEFLSIKFMYRPACGTNTAAKVYLAFDPNAANVSPTTKQQFLDALVAKDATAWAPMEVSVPKEMLLANGLRWLRKNALPANEDQQIFDTGKLYIAGSDLSPALLGELWVEYDVILVDPNEKGPVNTSLMVGNSWAANAPASWTQTGDSEDFNPVNGAISLDIWSIGEYLVVVYGAGTSPTVTGVTNNTGPAPVLLSSAQSATQAINVYKVRVNNVGGEQITFTPGGTWTSGSIRITEYDYSV